MKWNVEEIKKKISIAIPKGSVVPVHTSEGHFYAVDGQAPYPSVTAKIGILKDESIINFKMNRAVEYVFTNWLQFTEQNIMEHLFKARQASADIFEDAGDIGSEVHDYREKYFKDWLALGKRPENILSYIPPEQEDIRAISALRALDKFITDYNYEPIATELKVYSHDLKVAGTLDDLGMMDIVKKPGDPNCQHEWWHKPSNPLFKKCFTCDRTIKRMFCLMDIKTANQFKDHFFFQVALYRWMFVQLTGLQPDFCFINKLSKIDGTYKIEDLKKPGVLARYCRHMIKTNEGIEFIKGLRKDNQKKVVEI